MTVKSPQKFSQEEIKTLTNLQTEIDKLTINFGSLQIAKIKLENQEALLTKQLIDLEQKETETAKQLTAKYGKGSLNIETGEFTPTK